MPQPYLPLNLYCLVMSLVFRYLCLLAPVPLEVPSYGSLFMSSLLSLSFQWLSTTVITHSRVNSSSINTWRFVEKCLTNNLCFSSLIAVTPLWTVCRGLGVLIPIKVVILLFPGPRRSILRDPSCVTVKVPQGSFLRTGLG